MASITTGSPPQLLPTLDCTIVVGGGEDRYENPAGGERRVQFVCQRCQVSQGETVTLIKTLFGELMSEGHVFGTAIVAPNRGETEQD